MCEVRRLLLVVVLLCLSAAMPLSGAAAPGRNDEHAKQCQNEGWRTLAPEGSTVPFANQGECVSHGAQGGEYTTLAEPPGDADDPPTDCERAQNGDPNLSRANLRECDLSGVVISGADFSFADLYLADLTGAILTNANFFDANLEMANLNGALLNSAVFMSANLNMAKLSATALNADFTIATLTNANLVGAVLSGASFNGANLAGAFLSGADLAGADFSGADLSGALLDGANVTGAVLVGAVYENTICPDGTSSDMPDGDGFTCENNR